MTQSNPESGGQAEKSSPLGRLKYWPLIGALVVGLLVRLPGVLWGSNFPGGWQEHHVDEWTHIVNAEVLIRPSLPPRWTPHAYPRGTAVHSAAVLILKRLATGQLRAPLPPISEIATTGRIISVLYGTATIAVVFLLARRLFRDPRVATLASWIFALGGLHVTQSHFFLADVPSLFWILVGLYLLLLDQGDPDRNNSLYLMLGAAALGISTGIKLSVYSLLSLVIVAVWRAPRISRLLQAGVFFVMGFLVINGLTYTLADILRALAGAALVDHIRLPLATLSIQWLQLPATVSFPVLGLAIYGAWHLGRRVLRPGGLRRYRRMLVVTILPFVLYTAVVVAGVPYARHLIPFIPLVAMVSAWSLVQIMDRLSRRGVSTAVVLVPVFLYLGLFVFDGERLYIAEPRNDAARWLLENVPAGSSMMWFGHTLAPYKSVDFPTQGRPDVLVFDMHLHNPYVSGQGLRNSYPDDYRYVSMKTDVRSQERLETFQAIFRGESEYHEAARFSEHYYMPEFVWVDRLLGNQARNYLAEVVIFRKRSPR